MTLGPLPEYPWDAITPYRDRASAHPGGLLDLSIGSPVDPTPELIRRALDEAADAPAYPTTQGTEASRAAIAAWFERRRGVPGLRSDEIMLTVGSKEFVALTAFFLGIGEGDAIVQPEVAYPTYAMGAAFAGARIVASDDPADWPDDTKLVWRNSPGNPDGLVLDTGRLRASVERARELGAVVINDECYAELGWDDWRARSIPSILDPAVVGESRAGVLACSSLSKRSNLAGYRAAYAAGDAALIATLVRARKHAGLIVPGPVQHAMAVALGDDEHADAQRATYGARRGVLKPAVEAFGLRVEGSEAGLYLWGTRDEDAWATMSALADVGILAGPGPFYGAGGARHVRLSLTARDADIAAAAERLEGSARRGVNADET
ncbi:succinyldiaminopimelate transaminase [Pseudoclavibacter endophyticus]|uniref:Aminotransferase n=1 Tax=Pseudoclavibacter endophyticus TaxID=1778590 RepID=A0A6H9WPT1_9MICO|nr:succinyldiaminopimelate transaminase [Pseudoclavibacter endophyticus]KAB1649761.1 succinyldiaminopimelate transaminase [Pseudoclavibacter endophyticus]GGA59947.1 succinyldiaminopimelate transaminase [Pseudoclavibacter endophyticus]